MKPDGISTLNISNMLRSATRTGQAVLLRAQAELSSGRHADVGLTLGSLVSRNINWRAQISGLSLQSQQNGLSAAQAELTQSNLQTIKDVANNFISTLAGLRTSQNGQILAKDAAETALKAITQSLNTDFNGKFIFGGRNLTTAPIISYVNGSPQAASDAAFMTAFGVAQGDPLANQITPLQMRDYLDTNFKGLFSDASWQAIWSNATKDNIQTRIDGDQRINLSGNANNGAIRQLFQSIASVAGTIGPSLSDSTFQVVVDTAIAGAAQSIQGIGDEQSRIGFGQETLSKVAASNSHKAEILKSQIGATEGVDSYDAATRVNNLMSQLEMSFTITGKISKLSLINFL